MSQPTDCHPKIQHPTSSQLDDFTFSEEPYNQQELQGIISLNQTASDIYLSASMHQVSMPNTHKSFSTDIVHPIHQVAHQKQGREASSQAQINRMHEQKTIEARSNQDLAQPARARRRNQGLSNEEMKMLRKDLAEGAINKKGLMRKYSVSESTLNRYIRKFKEFQTTSQNLGQNFQALTPNYPLFPNDATSNSLHQRSECNQDMASDALYPEGYSPFVSRKKNSKVRMIESKVIQIYKQYPQIYQSEVASMLSEHFKQEITVHVVSRCLRNISNRQRELSLVSKPQVNAQGGRQLNPLEVTVQNRYAFARQFVTRSPKSIVYIDQMVFQGVIEKKEQTMHFVVGVSGEGNILHWKLKNHVFLSQQIAKFIDQIYLKHEGCTILLDNVNIHRQQPIRELFRTKVVSHLYLPPCSPQLNPVQPIFSYIAAQLAKRLKDNLTLHQTLKMAHHTILKMKQHTFSREVSYARQFIDVAYRREPFPFDQMPINSN